jgi:GNAT superfamily N-acetyltransferase
MARIEVTRTYLEMSRREELVPARLEASDLRVDRLTACPPSFYRYLYAEVGRAWRWVDRLHWTDEQIRAHLSRPEVELFLLSVGGSPAGYFELERRDDATEIAYFGLMAEYHGRGLGKHLLTVATEEAWRAAHRVWLHTCSLDGPAALPNYLRRGFRAFRTETYWFGEQE